VKKKVSTTNIDEAIKEEESQSSVDSKNKSHSYNDGNQTSIITSNRTIESQRRSSIKKVPIEIKHIDENEGEDEEDEQNLY